MAFTPRARLTLRITSLFAVNLLRADDSPRRLQVTHLILSFSPSRSSPHVYIYIIGTRKSCIRVQHRRETLCWKVGARYIRTSSGVRERRSINCSRASAGQWDVPRNRWPGLKVRFNARLIAAASVYIWPPSLYVCVYVFTGVCRSGLSARLSLSAKE